MCSNISLESLIGFSPLLIYHFSLLYLLLVSLLGSLSLYFCLMLSYSAWHFALISDAIFPPYSSHFFLRIFFVTGSYPSSSFSLVDSCQEHFTDIIYSHWQKKLYTTLNAIKSKVTKMKSI